MNRRKKTSSLGFPSLVLLGIAVVIVSSSGIGYVVMKNKQVTARSKIAQVQKRIDEHQVAITLHQSDIEQTLNWGTLKKLYAEEKPQFREIQPDDVEVYQEPDQETTNRGSIAQR